MVAALLLLDDDRASGGFWVGLVVFGIMALIVVLSVRAHRRKRRRIETWTASLGFKQCASLPESLRPPTLWLASPSTRRIFLTTYAGFACALFEVDQGNGESHQWVSALAIERSPGGPLLAEAVKRLGARLDQSSTPGWLVALIPNANAEQPVLEPLLHLLTRESWTGLID